MPAYLPAAADVAAEVPTRTKDALGNDTGAFTADTRPTLGQVNAAIASAHGEVSAAVGGEVIEDLVPLAKRATALLAAMTVETRHFPEQLSTGASPYPQLEERQARAMAILKEGVAEAGTAGDGESVAVGGGMAVHSFPPDAGGMIGWGTRW